MLRTHLEMRGAFYAAFVLMIFLELMTYISLIWHFFLSDIFPLQPVPLIITGSVYSFLALVFLIINLTGRKLCFKVLAFLYLSVAIFFPLKGYVYLQGRDFNPWGFYLMWIAILIVTFREIAIEIGSRSENPG